MPGRGCSADLADRSTLTAQLSAVFADRVAPQTAHDPGRVPTAMAQRKSTLFSRSSAIVH